MKKKSLRETELTGLYLKEQDPRKKRQHLNLLMGYYEDSFRPEVLNIIKNKYVLRYADREVGSEELYSQAIEILLNKIKDKEEILADLNFPAYMLGVCRNLYLEGIRKSKEIPTDEVKQSLTDDFLRDENPYESEKLQTQVENNLIDYYEKNNMMECLKIMYFGFKEGLKNEEIAKKLNLDMKDDSARRVTVIQQNCLKKAWRNVPLLTQVKEKYALKKRNRHIWKKI